MIIKIGKHDVELFSSVKELPVLRFQAFNKHLMFSEEVGSTMADTRQRVIKAMQFIKSDMGTDAIKELENLNLTIFNADQLYNPKGRAFATMVKRINQNHYKNYTNEYLDKCLAQLEEVGITQQQIEDGLDEVKKN